MAVPFPGPAGVGLAGSLWAGALLLTGSLDSLATTTRALILALEVTVTRLKFSTGEQGDQPLQRFYIGVHGWLVLDVPSRHGQTVLYNQDWYKLAVWTH